jgi:hypothetical protein
MPGFNIFCIYNMAVNLGRHEVPSESRLSTRPASDFFPQLDGGLAAIVGGIR